ncbi:alpha-glucosidase [Brevundimonas sp.]|uniref:alpha-glucosidase n=1 Tax=Brevundimonas sp. TaxID=1871086 RepID=UPI002FDA7081
MTAGASDDWRGWVLYQIYPRSFQDTTGDGIGDLNGIARRLEHIAGLGVDGVWLSPFFPSPMADFGYDVADYCGVDPMFGTLEDFDRLVERAHGLGLKVVIDQVYCHTSDRHPWFRASRENRTGAHADWYVWADARPDGSPPSNWQSVFGGPAWTWDARRGQYFMHNFLKEQPQLNLHHRPVQDALLDAARFWLDRGVDGFRLDALNFAMHDPALTDNPPEPEGRGVWPRTRPFDFQQHIHNQSQPQILGFLERLRGVTDAYGGRFTVAEVPGEDSGAERRAYTAPGRLNTAYGFDFLYAPELTAARVHAAMAEWPGAEGGGWPAWAFSNHDAPRAVSRWAPEADREAMQRMMTLLLMCLRGVVFLYQGEELGLPQGEVPFERLVDPEAIANWPRTLGRDGARTPMPWTGEIPWAGFSTVEPWLPVDARHPGLSVAVQDGDAGSMLTLARRLIALRKTHAALRTGAYRPVDAPGPLIAFERGEGAGALLCVFNPTGGTIDWALPGGWRAVEAVNGAGTGLGPYAAVVAQPI